MPTIDEQIAQSLRDAQRSGELQSAPSWGKPLDLNDGYEQTPEELRMAFKALKDAGFVPPEVETMKRIAALREVIQAAPDARDAEAMRRRLSELQQQLALRLEKLRVSRSL
jgi:predicted nucleic acid-binding Zn ribbon protein